MRSKKIYVLLLSAIFFFCFAHAQTGTTQTSAIAKQESSSTLSTTSPKQADKARIPVSDATFAGDRGFSEARQAREARASLKDSTFLEGLKAAITLTTPYKWIDGLSRPNFKNDPPASIFEFLEKIPLQLTNDEREFIVANGSGLKSLEWSYEKVLSWRKAKVTAEQHQVASLIASSYPALLLITVFLIRRYVRRGRLLTTPRHWRQQQSDCE